MAGAKRLHDSTADDDSSDAKRLKTKHPNNKLFRRMADFDPRSGWGEKNARVYVDGQGTVYDVYLHQATVFRRHNKFIRMQLCRALDKELYMIFTRQGIAGAKAAVRSSRTWTSAKQAIARFEKMFEEKTSVRFSQRLRRRVAGCYTYVDMRIAANRNDDYVDTRYVWGKISGAQCTLDGRIQAFMKFMLEKTTDLTWRRYSSQIHLPLYYKLSDHAITKGIKTLKELGDLFNGPLTASDPLLTETRNAYLSLIPRVVYANRGGPVLETYQNVQQELAMLRSMKQKEENKSTAEDKFAKHSRKIHYLDRSFHALGMQEMTALNRWGSEYLEIFHYLRDTGGPSFGRNFKINHVFRIERSAERGRFADTPKSENFPSRRLLWHGSAAANIASILATGLRKPTTVRNLALGQGIYMADCAHKSIDFCSRNDPGSSHCLLLVEAKVGSFMYEVVGADYAAEQRCKAAGRIATHSVGGQIPGAWKDAEVIHPDLKGVSMPDGPFIYSYQAGMGYSEYAVYNADQLRLRYLIWFELKI